MHRGNPMTHPPVLEISRPLCVGVGRGEGRLNRMNGEAQSSTHLQTHLPVREMVCLENSGFCRYIQANILKGIRELAPQILAHIYTYAPEFAERV